MTLLHCAQCHMTVHDDCAQVLHDSDLLRERILTSVMATVAGGTLTSALYLTNTVEKDLQLLVHDR